MHSIHHQVAIRAPLARVFRALNDQAEIGAWWCPQDVTDTPDGLVMSHQAGPYGTVRLRVLRRDAATGVTWTDSPTPESLRRIESLRTQPLTSVSQILI